jgi:DNA primase catalytic core
MKIPEGTVERIRDAARIEEVAGEFIGLRKKGVNYVGVCPFHADTSPSMFVSPAKQIFKCFACGTGGDAIKFIMEHERLSFPEALRYLARKYGIDIPDVELSREEIEREKRRESLLIILKKSQEFFRSSLAESPEAQQYLTGVRGLSPEILELYGAGYAAGGDRLFTFLTRAGYDPELQIASGVVCRHPERKSSYDHQRNRVTFPFPSLSGRVTGFTGRSLTEGGTAAKYLNTPETDLFHKGKTLFGLYQAKQEIVRCDEVLLVEGQFDVLSMAQAGYPNTVCGSGTALTDEQVKLLARFTRNVTLLYDGDAAGVAASFKNIRQLLSHGMKVRAVRLPEGEDPDSFARKMTATAFSLYLTEHRDSFIQYIYSAGEKDFGDPYKKEAVLEQICECISAVPENSLRRQFIQSAAALFGMDEPDIKAKVTPPSAPRPEIWQPEFWIRNKPAAPTG